MLQGDNLSVQLFIGAAAMTALSVGMTSAGWTHRRFVWFMFILAAFLAVVSVGWASVELRIPLLADFLGRIAATRIAWFFAGIIPAVIVGMRFQDFWQARKSLPKIWLVPYDAAFAFGDKEKIAKFHAVENKVSETAEKCRTLDHEEQGLSGDSFFNPENSEKNFKLIGKLANEQARAREANKAAADFRDALENDLESDVRAALREGHLIAKGFLSPHVAGKPAMVRGSFESVGHSAYLAGLCSKVLWHLRHNTGAANFSCPRQSFRRRPRRA
jgi:hypothetical protein